MDKHYQVVINTLYHSTSTDLIKETLFSLSYPVELLQICNIKYTKILYNYS